MGWKDFFYFSKGERRALILLVLIISTAFILLLVKDNYITNSQNAEVVKVDALNKEMSAIKTQELLIHDSISTSQTTESTKPSVESKPSVSARTKFTAKPRFSKSASTFSQKFPKGTIVELNSADTTVLKKVPGIGSTFSNRIIKFRELLGGFHNISQLREVYGIDDDKFNQLKSWFEADTSQIRKLKVNALTFETLSRHPYLSYKQTRAIIRLRERKGQLTGWEMLDLLNEFSAEDKQRLKPYISFD